MKFLFGSSGINDETSIVGDVLIYNAKSTNVVVIKNTATHEPLVIDFINGYSRYGEKYIGQ